MLSPHEKIIQFVLEQSAQQPLCKRISLYRSLAEIAGSPKDTQQLKTLADELECADARCAEFAFHFSQKAKV